MGLALEAGRSAFTAQICCCTAGASASGSPLARITRVRLLEGFCW
jgi:hypothetical protein